MTTLKAVQNRTFDEMCQCLEQHRMCCVERPTGFGKTKLFMDYARRYPNEKFLYVFDVNSVVADIRKKYNPSNIEFLSYAAISREERCQDTKRFMCSQPWHTIIFDEAHLMGGDNVQKVLLDIIPMAVIAGVRILGGTATKLRTDLMDVSKRFFNGHVIFEYTIMDAVRDKIMKEPVWTLTAHYSRLLWQMHQDFDNRSNSYTKAALRQLDKAYAHLDGIAPVYRDTIQSVYGCIPDIMRFIVFYPNIKSLSDNIPRDTKHFQDAFPTHTVQSVALSSDPGHASAVSDVEDMFVLEGRQVQLIFSVNMLNQAYHSDLLTGIVMYRSTFSDIIFTQELGRVMSVTAPYPGIVFDNVGNVLVRPDRARALLQRQAEDWTKTPSGNSVPRGHFELSCKASNELINFLDVYTRIKATSQLTQEQVDYAKYLTQDMNAPIELVMKGLNISHDIAERLVQDG